VILIWTARALANRRRIRQHIERDNPDAAIRLDERLTRKAELLLHNP
jgi:plasmid stabilization system protein ParE